MKKNLKANITLVCPSPYHLFSSFGLISAGIIDIYYTQILMGIGISIIMALGTNLVLGFSGQLSLGQAGFMAIGAYATAILTTQNLLMQVSIYPLLSVEAAQRKQERTKVSTLVTVY